MKYKWLVWLMIGLALVATAGSIFDAILTNKDAEWQARVDRVLEDAEAGELVRDSALAYADSMGAWADSVVAQADARAPVIRERVHYIRDSIPVPDTCWAAVAPRDSIIDVLQTENDRLRIAFTAERTAAQTLRGSLIAADATIDSLVSVLRARPRARPWLPELRIGPQAGIGFDGTAHAGVGINIGWKIPLNKLF